ncbi:MAG: FHA domain-containing protein [Actinomycetota bacterium]|nr:FHA domain-containing protein [Actinomycetota bacterium]
MFCTNCGHRSPDGGNFCSSCGAALAPERSETTVSFTPVDDHGESPDEEPVVTQVGVPYGTPTLVVKRGPTVGASYALKSHVTSAGRHPESDIFLDDITVSRRHAEFTRGADGRMVVRDLGSLNGTYVNRERIEEHFLSTGDEVQIGKFKLVYLVAGTE